jgi:hypothetical protein
VKSRGDADFSYLISKPDDFEESFYVLAGGIVQETSQWDVADGRKRPCRHSVFGYTAAPAATSSSAENDDDLSVALPIADTEASRYYVRDTAGSPYQAVELVDVFRRIGLLATMYFCLPWRFLRWLVVTDARIQKAREDIALKLLELEPTIDVQLPKLSPRRNLRCFCRVVFFTARRCLDITAKHMERAE